VISITSPSPPNSLEFRHFGTAPECHQSPTKDATTAVGRPCWKKLLLTIGVLLFLAILGVISFVNFSLWTRLVSYNDFFYSIFLSLNSEGFKYLHTLTRPF
jgi:hypothetical protein